MSNIEHRVLNGEVRSFDSATLRSGPQAPCGDDLRQIAASAFGLLAMTVWGGERFQIADFRLHIEGGEGALVTLSEP